MLFLKCFFTKNRWPDTFKSTLASRYHYIAIMFFVKKSTLKRAVKRCLVIPQLRHYFLFKNIKYIVNAMPFKWLVWLIFSFVFFNCYHICQSRLVTPNLWALYESFLTFNDLIDSMNSFVYSELSILHNPLMKYFETIWLKNC